MIKLELETPFNILDIKRFYNDRNIVLDSPASIGWGIYVSHMEVEDGLTGIIAKGIPKLGRCKYLYPISRGRNQSGGVETIDAFWQLSTRQDSYTAEAFLKKHPLIKPYNEIGRAGQKELYRIDKEKFIPIVDKLIREKYVIL